jgi:zinc transporter ZupT
MNTTTTTTEHYKDNVPLAFALVLGAGSATALGASVVFVPKLVQYANRKTLACGLGISSGVMIYVSFVEILQKSRVAFIQAGLPDDVAYAYATICFFAGVVVMVVRCIMLCCCIILRWIDSFGKRSIIRSLGWVFSLSIFAFTQTLSLSRFRL